MKPKVYIFGAKSALAKELKSFLIDKVYVYSPDIDITDERQIYHYVCEKPDYIINCGAMSGVTACDTNPIKAANVNYLAIVRILERIKQYSPQTKFLNIGSDCELTDDCIYGLTKKATSEIIKLYREKYNLFAVRALCSQMYSVHSKLDFIVPKIINWAVKFKVGIKEKIELGNIETRITVISMGEVCDGIWKMLNRKTPDDFVLSSNAHYSIRSIINFCGQWTGHFDFEDYISISPDLFNTRQEIYMDMWVNRTKTDLPWHVNKTYDQVLTELLNHSYDKTNNI